MSDQDRLEQLEQRMLRLEQLMRQVLQVMPERAAGLRPPPMHVPVVPVPPAAPPLSTLPPVAAPAPMKAPPPRPPSLDGEQWVGQRGLLAVGVVAVVLAAGYLLKLSFDRGWISPLMRCLGGAAAGLGVAVLGWSVERRGYRTYGPALIGTGAAIIYLSVWAASRLYGFLPPAMGIGAMALVALALSAAAWKMDAEALGAVAAVGAFLAPIVIGNVDADADRLLAYLAAIGFTMGAVAWEKGWRLTALLIGASYFGLGLSAADAAHPLAILAYGACGGAAGLALGLKRDWWETRFLSFWGGWSCLTFADSVSTAPLVLLAGIALSYPVWDFALKWDGVWPFGERSEQRRPILPSLYFYVTPLWLIWAVDRLGYPAFTTYPGLAAAIVGIAYLAIGLTGRRRAFAVVGTLGVLGGAMVEWDWGLVSAGVAGLLALAWGGVGRVTRRSDWNLHALVAVAMALLVHQTQAVTSRPLNGPAFTDSWALVMWGLIAVAIALATDLAAPDDDPRTQRTGALWVMAGLMLLVGVTGELHRFFRLNVVDPQTASLAGGLAISVWWLLFAGACILVGFRRGLRPLRVAGLWVSGLAVMKVVLIDLGTLDALYRVGSVFGLGLVSLLVAWSYHRRARLDAADLPSDR